MRYDHESLRFRGKMKNNLESIKEKTVSYSYSDPTLEACKICVTVYFRIKRGKLELSLNIFPSYYKGLFQ